MKNSYLKEDYQGYIVPNRSVTRGLIYNYGKNSKLSVDNCIIMESESPKHNRRMDADEKTLYLLVVATSVRDWIAFDAS